MDKCCCPYLFFLYHCCFTDGKNLRDNFPFDPVIKSYRMIQIYKQGYFSKRGNFQRIAQFVKMFSKTASSLKSVLIFGRKVGLCSDSMGQIAFPTKIFINLEINQELTLSGRRWIVHGSSKESGGKEAGSKETRSKGSGKEEIILLNYHQKLFFDFSLRLFCLFILRFCILFSLRMIQCRHRTGLFCTTKKGFDFPVYC